MSLSHREDSLSIPDKERIDRICLTFEDGWLAGKRPVLETYLAAIPNRVRPQLLRELLLIELEYRRGLAESVRLDDYLKRFPDRPEEVRSAFAEIDRLTVRRRFLPGQLIGRYQVRRLLGSGAFASVYLAWDSQLERQVAIKVPHATRLEAAADRDRFLEEARAVAQLKHPGIVDLFDVSRLPDGTVYLVMQYVDGISLRELLDCGPLIYDKASQIAAEVARAVGAAHRVGVIHRDLKPSNILIDREGIGHVTDFGLAIRESNQYLRVGECAGTLAYMAPEQVRGETHQLDGRADIWAVGVLLYEMLTERLPFAGSSQEQLSEEILNRDPRPPRQIDGQIPRQAESVCLRCLAKRPADRFATAEDVADQLFAAQQARKHGRHWFALAAIVLIAGLGTLGWRPARQWASRPAPHVSPPPISGHLDILIWNPSVPSRQGLSLGQHGMRWLQLDDRIRLEIQLSQPKYIYIVWLDSQHQPLPVYPWRRGQWDTRPTKEMACLHLALPDRDDHGWDMQSGPSGIETVVLMVRSSPLPADVDLDKIFRQAPRLDLGAVNLNALIQQKTPLSDRPDEDRSPELNDALCIEDPLLQFQTALKTRLGEHFSLVRTVSFYFQGTPDATPGLGANVPAHDDSGAPPESLDGKS